MMDEFTRYRPLLFSIADGQIQALHSVLNPDKLAYLVRQLGPT